MEIPWEILEVLHKLRTNGAQKSTAWGDAALLLELFTQLDPVYRLMLIDNAQTLIKNHIPAKSVPMIEDES